MGGTTTRPPAPRRWRAVIAALALAAATATAGLGAVGTTPGAAAQAQCTAPAWNSAAMYDQGAVVAHRGHQWRANHWLWAGVEPGVSGSPPWWVPWADQGPCGPATTTTTAPPGSTTTTTPGSTTTTTTPPDPGDGVEEHFAATGPSAVTTAQAGDAAGTYTLAYPTDFASDGTDNAVVAYGNGTGGSCDGPSAPVLDHLASWGFVVVCPNSGSTGWGTEIWAGAQHLIAQAGNPSSIFHGELDTAAVGAAGHSQGATGAANATVLSNGVITSTVGLATVDPGFHFPADQLPAFGQIDDPIFFVSGTADFLTSQSSQQNYFNQVRGPAAKAAVVGADHNSMIPASLGYVTAWFRYTLGDDGFARQAFVGSPPEINANAAWTNQAQRNLP